MQRAGQKEAQRGHVSLRGVVPTNDTKELAGGTAAAASAGMLPSPRESVIRGPRTPPYVQVRPSDASPSVERLV